MCHAIVLRLSDDTFSATLVGMTRTADGSDIQRMLLVSRHSLQVSHKQARVPIGRRVGGGVLLAGAPDGRDDDRWQGFRTMCPAAARFTFGQYGRS
jgi:hypothetical protein